MSASNDNNMLVAEGLDESAREDACKALAANSKEPEDGLTAAGYRPSVFFPPGGLLIWIIIYLELITFGVAMVVLAVSGAAERYAFHRDSQQLNKTIGTLNTFFLLTSGFLVAKAMEFFRQKKMNHSASYLSWAILSGVGFLLLKLVEYASKLEAGLDMSHSSFFMFYWLLTGFHWVHVLVGTVILVVLRQIIIRKKESASLQDLEAGSAFWHMCDLIWLLLFPLLYLIF